MTELFKKYSISDIPKLKKIFESKSLSTLHIGEITKALDEINTFWIYMPSWNTIKNMTDYSKFAEDVAYFLYCDFKYNKITIDTKCLIEVDSIFINKFNKLINTKHGIQEKLENIL